MTICSGCGAATDATICCPICLKNNKKIFYCSQECFEANYSEHKKIHYFIKMISSEEMHSKMLERDGGSERHNLPVIILGDENGVEAVDRSPFQANLAAERGNSDVSVNYDVSDHHEGGDSYATSVETKKGTQNSKFENMYRKKNNKKYKRIGNNDYLFDDSSEQNDTSENNSYKGNRKRSKLSTYMHNLSGYLFCNKYNMILPYYNDMSVNPDKINLKNGKGKNKLSEKKIQEIKKQIKKKRIFQLTILLVVISIVVILATCIFSYILETSQKNLQINSEILINKNNAAKNAEIVELKSYINVIEDLRKEIYEMKEVLYTHNVFLSNKFNLNSSYPLFNNSNKMKSNPAATHSKKSADKLGSLTSHLFYDSPSSTSDGIYNYGNAAGDKKADHFDSSVRLTQQHYDINDIHEVSNSVSGENAKHVEGEINLPDRADGEGEHSHSQMKDLSETFPSSAVENADHAVGENTPSQNGEVRLSNENINEPSGDPLANEEELVQENVKNFIKNHNMPNNVEQAKITNVIVNEEKPINSKNLMAENISATSDTQEVGINSAPNENDIHSHEEKLKRKKYTSKGEGGEGDNNTERKFSSSKLNKKKQNTI
ncbi:conserved Plasmodium protein, unknown function [Plasmodium knowlesi strain H]|uniref:C6H2-type domain-containing protein n=3 Tax=Plasmodium knowlesi TaxID=5850 RepID=A0A5K1U9Z5_PLAKH|nr:HP12 protein homolog, putative [Plasmodium knowlesi strain H]OTN66774.1 Uncharacterized protein PKNOH_S08489500 [Plasmodium knowlesi]CAA9986832.1 HP12 protein homolog, putative [Plasmodium knowlesi strain H]SBO23680.1 conserved Plasmodium protein, unknown function [Plasmodium knowlesi strain H]SBO25270.1 conserved Plasmodium protein, unknown function [Plasmodium knowlesi strain H]VVS76306.1 HP12 protein homolog, putative [Plasmodium knowlesi strain H]|eukprot:XP_002260684.1 hypothetical protein, conserved in Plasmodium species [Plasmodium knowlesi strain H]